MANASRASQLIVDEIDCEQPIFLGGPVSGPLVALHRVKSAAEMEVLPGLYFAADKYKLQKVITQSAKHFRFFTGYAGWASGQLEEELKEGGGLTLKAKKSLIFHHGDDLWEQVVRAIGEGILGASLQGKHVPPDPSLN